MVTERLLTLAYQFRSEKFWKKFYETEFFAVPLPNGEIGICCNTGFLESRASLTVYRGEKGLRSLRSTYEMDGFISPARQQEIMLSQYCLKCDFENKAELQPEDVDTVQQFAKSHGIRLNGKFSYAEFSSFCPNRLPSPLTEKEAEMLCHALSAAIEVSQKAQTSEDKTRLGFRMCKRATGVIPMLTQQENGEWQWGSYTLPDTPAEKYPEPLFENNLLLHKLKKLKKQEEWMCDVIPAKSPVIEKEEKDGLGGYFPSLLMILMESQDAIILTKGVQDYQSNCTALLYQLSEFMEKTTVLPAKIMVSEEKTLLLLHDMCKKLNIQLALSDELFELANAEFILYQTDEHTIMIQTIINHLLESEEDPSQLLPQELLNDLREMDETGLLPPEVSKKLNPKPKAVRKIQSKGVKGKKGRKKKYSDQSLVISVSLGKGCYRHIMVSASDTLEDLAEYILDIFEFDDDHMYAFFMDDKLWSQTNVYYSDIEEMSGIYTQPKKSSAVRLGDFGFNPKDKFKFLFDFGDAWVFQCKILKVLEQETTEFDVVKSKGEAPLQYPDWDDEEE